MKQKDVKKIYNYNVAITPKLIMVVGKRVHFGCHY